MLLDRFGPRRMLILGTVTMATGQLLVFAVSLPLALTERFLIGAGLAATLTSVIRLIAAWFPTGQDPPPAATPLYGALLGADAATRRQHRLHPAARGSGQPVAHAGFIQPGG